MNDMLLYQMMEVDYIKTMNREVSSDYNANKDLFPFGWFSNTNYRGKIAILNEAIETNTLIMDTKLYNESIEGVKKI